MQKSDKIYYIYFLICAQINHLIYHYIDIHLLKNQTQFIIFKLDFNAIMSNIWMWKCRCFKKDFLQVMFIEDT